MGRVYARPRVIRGTRTAPLPLLPSGPGGVCSRPLHGARDLTSIYRSMCVKIRKVEPGRCMQGIQFLTDNSGKKVAVQIDLKRHARLWEDIQDVLVANSRRKEKSISIDRVGAAIAKRA